MGRAKLYLKRSSAGPTVVDDEAPCRNDTVVAAESGRTVQGCREVHLVVDAMFVVGTVVNKWDIVPVRQPYLYEIVFYLATCDNVMVT